MKKLTAREVEVFDLMCLGYSNQEIAKILFVSAHTIKAHVSSIIYKIEAKNRTHAIYLHLIPYKICCDMNKNCIKK